MGDKRPTLGLTAGNGPLEIPGNISFQTRRRDLPIRATWVPEYGEAPIRATKRPLHSHPIFKPATTPYGGCLIQNLFSQR